jgi:hypothetical protein
VRAPLDHSKDEFSHHVVRLRGFGGQLEASADGAPASATHQVHTEKRRSSMARDERRAQNRT